MKFVQCCALVVLSMCFFVSCTLAQNQQDISGSGTAHFIPQFTSRTTIGNSRVFQFASLSSNGWLNLLGIGTTAPGATLDINVGAHQNAFSLGTFSAGSFFIRDTGIGSIDMQTFNADLTMQCCSDNGNIFMFPASSGHLGIGIPNSAPPPNIITVKQGSDTEPIADAWTTYSSLRWKTNIHPIVNALSKVEQLRGVTFDWKANGKHDLGVVAEEVAPVLPEIVGFERNGNAESVDYGRISALLIEAIKEQQAEITELKSEIEEMSAKQ